MIQVEIKKKVCVNCPEKYQGLLTPGKVYDFIQQRLIITDTVFSTHFIADEGTVMNVHFEDYYSKLSDPISERINSDFITLEEHRHNQLKKLKI